MTEKQLETAYLIQANAACELTALGTSPYSLRQGQWREAPYFKLDGEGAQGGTFIGSALRALKRLGLSADVDIRQIPEIKKTAEDDPKFCDMLRRVAGLNYVATEGLSHDRKNPDMEAALMIGAAELAQRLDPGFHVSGDAAMLYSQASERLSTQIGGPNP